MDCREFEYRLWETPDKFKVKEKLPAEFAGHLEACPRCAVAYAEFIRLFGIAAGSELKRDDAYWDKFDSGVWQRIESMEAGTQYSAKTELLSRYKLGYGQLLASLGLAAATVTVFMLAISSIIDQPQVADIVGRAEKKAMRGAPDINTQTVLRHYNVIFKRDKVGGFEIKEFSLLPEPEVNVVDDSASVSIEAAYLTDEGLEAEEMEITRALSRELVAGKGKVSSVISEAESKVVEAPDSNFVITVEKMPRMIKAVPPSYPPFAFKMKRNGEVWIKAHIDANGDVQNALIHQDSGTNFGFEEAALAAAYKNKFEPFEVNGKKVPVWVIYKVKFISRN